MIVVTVADGEREYPDGERFLTEEMFNNLCVHDKADRLLAVFAQDKWISAEVVS